MMPPSCLQEHLITWIPDDWPAPGDNTTIKLPFIEKRSSSLPVLGSVGHAAPFNPSTFWPTGIWRTTTGGWASGDGPAGRWVQAAHVTIAKPPTKAHGRLRNIVSSPYLNKNGSSSFLESSLRKMN